MLSLSEDTRNTGKHVNLSNMSTLNLNHKFTHWKVWNI